jgi:hypothetical protein
VSEFEFFGETFHLRPSNECQVAMLDFAELASGDVDETSLQGLAVVKGFLRDVVVPRTGRRSGSRRGRTTPRCAST